MCKRANICEDCAALIISHFRLTFVYQIKVLSLKLKSRFTSKLVTSYSIIVSQTYVFMVIQVLNLV